jgi:hypothetical protein
LLYSNRTSPLNTRSSNIPTNNTFAANVVQAVRESIDRVEVPRGDHLENEFESNDSIILGSFFYLFPLGMKLPSNGSLPDAFVRHLLLQHDHRFERDQQFLCFIFNQKQRHAVTNNVSAKITSNPRLIASLSQLINAPNFNDRLAEAIAQPTSPAARSLLNDVMPAIKLTGKRIPFGPIERGECLSELYAYCQFFGLPTWFWTVSPNDIGSSMVMRIGAMVKASQQLEIPLSAARAIRRRQSVRSSALLPRGYRRLLRPPRVPSSPVDPNPSEGSSGRPIWQADLLLLRRRGAGARHASHARPWMGLDTQ